MVVGFDQCMQVDIVLFCVQVVQVCVDQCVVVWIQCYQVGDGVDCYQVQQCGEVWFFVIGEDVGFVYLLVQCYQYVEDYVDVGQ